jgi:hypothetical protein
VGHCLQRLWATQGTAMAFASTWTPTTLPHHLLSVIQALESCFQALLGLEKERITANTSSCGRKCSVVAC